LIITRIIWALHVARTGMMRNILNILTKKLKGKHNFEVMEVDGRLILKLFI
jgi:hypothetical protein